MGNPSEDRKGPLELHTTESSSQSMPFAMAQDQEEALMIHSGFLTERAVADLQIKRFQTEAAYQLFSADDLSQFEEFHGLDPIASNIPDFTFLKLEPRRLSVFE